MSVLHWAFAAASVRGRTAAAVLAITLIGSAAAEDAARLRLYWDGLSITVDRTVSAVMPGGAVITGKSMGLEPDALLVNVKKTTNPLAYPKGLVRVPREQLRILEMQTRGKLGRVIVTSLGAIAGGVVGAFAVFGLTFSRSGNEKVATVAGAGIVTGGFVGGYLIGRAIDTHWTTIEIAP